MSTRMFRLFAKKTRPIVLGRWNPQYAARKAELANHDHCGGPQCSQTVLTKTKREDKDVDSHIALCALQSFHSHQKK